MNYTLLLAIVIFALLVALVPVMEKARKWLIAKEANIKNDTVRSALQWATNEALTTAETIVNALNQTVVGKMKSDALENGGNGKLTDAQIAQLKADSKKLFKNTISQEALTILSQHKTDIESYIENLIQEFVVQAKNKLPLVLSNLAPVKTSSSPTVNSIPTAMVDESSNTPDTAAPAETLPADDSDITDGEDDAEGDSDNADSGSTSPGDESPGPTEAVQA